MRLQYLLRIGALLLSSDFAAVQTASSTVSISTPSGTFNAVAALAAYGVNVSGFGTGDTGSAKLKRELENYTAGCLFSVSRIHVAEFCSSSADLENRCQCSTLSLLYSSSVSSQGSSSYNLLESGYWSNQQAEVNPCCIFQPSTSVQVAVALLLSRLTQCPFAVKSGGHAAFAGASNIQGGITVDFAKMNEIQLSSNKNIVSLGPGNTWFDVYQALEPEDLTAIGGRVAAIGVGGLTLGGERLQSRITILPTYSEC